MAYFNWLQGVVLFAYIFSTNASAENFTLNTFSFLITNQAKPDAIYGYGTSDKDLQMLQYEHFSTHNWGDIYFDAELFHGNDVGTPVENGNNTQHLLVLNPRLSLGKLTNNPLRWGPINDVSLISRWEASSYPSSDRFLAQNYGFSLNFDVPGFSWFESGVLYRDTNFDPDTWLWRTVLMSKPLIVENQKFHFNLLSLINGSTNNGTEVFERGDILWEIGGNSKAQLGVRLEYASYDNDPLKSSGDYNRFTPFLMFKYTP